MPSPPTTQNKLNSKSNPQTASYLKVIPVGYYNDAGGSEIMIINAMIPGDDRDENYEGTANIEIIESNPNGSAMSFIPYGEMIIPSDTVHLYDGEGVIIVMNMEPETLGVYVTDEADSLKGSIPVAYFVKPASSTNLLHKALIEGPDTTNSSNLFFMQDMFYISVVDSSGMVDTSLCYAMDTTRVRVKVVDDPDSTAYLYDLFNDRYVREFNIPMFRGRGWLFFFNWTDVSETVKIVAEDIDTLNNFSSDTFSVYSTVEEIATKLFPYSVTGACGNVNKDKIYYLLAMLDGPDPTNSSTEVKLEALDISGSQSITITPSNFITLASGIYSFKVKNTENDVFTFFFPESEGSPYLYNYVPVFMGGFLDSGQAVMIEGKIPTMIPVNDTFYTECYTKDISGTFDDFYKGWVNIYADDYHGLWSVAFVDTDGVFTDVFRINDGVARFGFYDTEVETIMVGYEDAEGGEPFSYLGNNMLSDFEVAVLPIMEPESLPTRWVLTEHNDITSPGKSIYVTVAALDGSGAIDPTFTGPAYLSVTGDALVIPDTLFLDNGIGIVEVVDSIYETVYLTASGSGPASDMDTLMFIPPDSAAYIMTEGYGDVMVNDTASVSGWILTAAYTLADNYNGYVKVSTQYDVRNPNTVYPLEAINPDSVPVTNGNFSGIFSDSEPEYISLIIEDVRGKLQPNKSDGLFYTELDKYLFGPHEVNLEDTAIVILKDIYGDTIKINSGIYEDTFDYYINEIGGSIPFSFNFTSPNPAGFQNGVSYCSFYNTEIETLEVYLSTRDDELFRNYGLIDKVFYAGLDDKREYFMVHANPVQKGDLSVNYSIPMDGKVEITVFDIAGRQIYKNEANLKKGVYRFTNKKMSSGIYFVNVKYNDILDSRKIVLLH
jgi:hypothetical protein